MIYERCDLSPEKIENLKNDSGRPVDLICNIGVRFAWIRIILIQC